MWHTAEARSCTRLADSMLGHTLTIQLCQQGATVSTDLAQLVWRPAAPSAAPPALAAATTSAAPASTTLEPPAANPSVPYLEEHDRHRDDAGVTTPSRPRDRLAEGTDATDQTSLADAGAAQLRATAAAAAAAAAPEVDSSAHSSAVPASAPAPTPAPMAASAAAKSMNHMRCKTCDMRRARLPARKPAQCRLCNDACLLARRVVRVKPGCVFRRGIVGNAMIVKLKTDPAIFQSEAWQRADDAALEALCGVGCCGPGGCFWDQRSSAPDSATIPAATLVPGPSHTPANVPNATTPGSAATATPEAAAPLKRKRSAADQQACQQPARTAQRVSASKLPSAQKDIRREPTRKTCRWCTRPHDTRRSQCKDCATLRCRLQRGLTARGLVWDCDVANAAARTYAQHGQWSTLWSGGFEAAARALLGPDCLVPGVRFAGANTGTHSSAAEDRNVAVRAADRAAAPRIWETAPGVLRVTRIHLLSSRCPCALCVSAHDAGGTRISADSTRPAVAAGVPCADGQAMAALRRGRPEPDRADARAQREAEAHAPAGRQGIFVQLNVDAEERVRLVLQVRRGAVQPIAAAAQRDDGGMSADEVSLY